MSDDQTGRKATNFEKYENQIQYDSVSLTQKYHHS